MPKRTREDSPPPSTPSPPPSTPDASSAASIDERFHSSKYIQISEKAPIRAVMKCSLPPHELIDFTTFEEFEVHYAKVHAYRCSECIKNLPSEHFLQLHISENHDPLSEAKRARGEKTYHCFVDDCDKVCSTPQKRRMHLTDKHMFPKTYDFFVVNTGIDKRSSMLRPRHRRQSSAASRPFRREQRPGGPGDNYNINPDASKPPEPIHETRDNSTSMQGPSTGTDVDELASTMSALKFVPPSVRFGRGGRRGGLSRS